MVKEYAINGWPINKQRIPTKFVKYWHIRGELLIVEGSILKYEQIVFPPSLRNYILQNLHTTHLGVEKSIAQARKTVYWPGRKFKKYYMSKVQKSQSKTAISPT